MPLHCCVPHCKQRGGTYSDGSKVSFHGFPRHEEVYKKWIIAIRRDEGVNFRVTEYTKVCSRHFKESDFIPGVASGKKLLRDAAVPSVFCFRKQCKVRKPPKPRALPLLRRTVKPPGQVLPTQEPTDNDDGVVNQDAGTSSSIPMEATESSLEPTGRNSSSAVLECLSTLVKEQEKQIANLRYECSSLREQLGSAKATVRKLQAENESLASRLAEEKERTSMFAIERFKDSDEDIMFYCGLPGYEHFVALLRFLDPGDNGCNVLRAEGDGATQSGRGRKRKLSSENELFLVLVRLRLGLFEADLADRFCIAQSTVSRICTSWINFMYLKLSTLPLWSPREIIDATMPPEFAQKYALTRVILCATEIKCEVPSSLSLQSSTYSPYTSSNTFRGLIGVSPNGLVTFVSELFTGSISDRECTVRSGFLELDFEQTDSVMADKGFRIEDLLQNKGIKLNLPPFLRSSTFSKDEVQEAKEIASLRIHVERRIQRIKGYHIFDRPVPLTLAPVVNQIWTVTAILTNFQSPLIQH
ncbi:unnamed protein product [Ixodes persulcatus]